MQLALLKARAVGERHPDALIIGADTLVECNGQLLGKPQDLNDARLMLRRLSGATHRVFTGLALFDVASESIATRVGITTIRLRSIDDREIEAYLRTAEPYDKASALAVQGLGGVFLEHMDGEFSNVVGLPLSALNELLAAAGCCLICRQVAAAVST
jgi:septum formation protein